MKTLFSKNSVGLVLSLLAVLVFSQVKMLHFMTDSILGRIILVALLLVIGYLNKFLGIVVVLIIIIMTNNLTEGFDSKNKPFKLNALKNNTIQKKVSKALQPLSQVQMQVAQAAEAVSGEDIADEAVKVSSNEVVQSASDEAVQAVAATESFSLFGEAKSYSEGPDVLEMENTLKRGKNSNTINVQHGTQNADGVDPYDSFFGNFTAF